MAVSAAPCVERKKLMEESTDTVGSSPMLQHIASAMGNVMGGAIFTLADFALAICCNIGEEPTVSVDSSISFFRSTQGAALTATAVCDKPGRHLGFYTVTVEDDLGKQIAKMTATCYR